MGSSEFRILHGDCIEQMRTLDEASIDAIVTDPPYGLGFMGKTWDSTFESGDSPMRRRPEVDAVNAGAARQGGRQRQGLDYQRRMARDSRTFGEWCETWATEALRVLKPGGHLIAFGGTRTYHRLACAIEDAGFEIRDCLAWLYGSGFPKSLDVSKAIDKAAGVEREVVGTRTKAGMGSETTFAQDEWTQANRGPVELDVTAPATPEAAEWQGWGTALKPAHKPIVLARKPLTGTVAGNVLAHGTGALNVDDCRVGFRDEADERESKEKNRHGDFDSAPPDRVAYGVEARSGGETGNYDAPGRWPANVVLDPEAGAMLDEQAGDRAAGNFPANNRTGFGGTYRGETEREGMVQERRPTEAGGASRFFFTARTSDGEGIIDRCDASPAEPSSPPPSAPGDSAPAPAATADDRGGRPSSASTGRTTSGTPSRLSESGESDTRTTPSTGSESSPESQHGRRTPTPSPASDAAQTEPTGTTTTTASHSKSAGSAEAATSPSTSSSTAPGAKDSPLPLDSGEEVRFRYCPKAGRGERNAGLEGLPSRVLSVWGGDEDDLSEGKKATRPTANVHPTVKPIDLMRWLCRLVTPPGGTVLDPFTGSGTTGCAAVLEGFDFIGCEREDEYRTIAEARIAYWSRYPGAETDAVLASDAKAKPLRDQGQLDLLGEAA